MVFDYDGTLTLENGSFPRSTEKVLRELCRSDLATLGIVSGRDLEFLRRTNDSLSKVFSFLVAENGAISYFEDTEERLVRGEDWSKQARVAFSEVDYPIRFSEIIASTNVGYADKVSKTLKLTGLDAKIVLNKDSVMVMPPSVDKGTGVSSAIAHFGNTKPLRVTCFGDGENDEALFGPADFTVAVSNAVPSLKRIADFVTTRPGGLGVVEFLKSKYPALSQ